MSQTGSHGSDDDIGDALYVRLFAAIRSGNLQALRDADCPNLDYVPSSDNVRGFRDGLTLAANLNALALACELGSVVMVAELLDNGASPNLLAHNEQGWEEYNTYAPLYYASLLNEDKPQPPEPRVLPRPSDGVQQRITRTATGGVGIGPPLPPTPVLWPPTAVEEIAAREAIVNLLVEHGAGTELDESKRPTVVNHIRGWEASVGALPPFSPAQTELIRRARASRCEA